MGRPIITTNVPGCRDTVVKGENGFLVPKKNVNALVEKMEWFIQNPEAIEIMGLKSYELCINKFDVAIINSKMMTVMNL